jgi:hypothetical protein
MMRVQRLLIALALNLALALALLKTRGAGSVLAANYNVPKFIDDNRASDADCSLPEAVIIAHIAPGSSTIILRARTYSLTPA